MKAFIEWLKIMGGYLVSIKQKIKVRLALYLLAKTVMCFDLKIQSRHLKCFFVYYFTVWPFKHVLKAMCRDEHQRAF